VGGGEGKYEAEDEKVQQEEENDLCTILTG
jgi:hypothetical protein